MSLSQEIAAWVAAIGTVLVAILAVFREVVLDLLLRPKLSIRVSVEAPDAVKIPLRGRSRDGSVALVDAYYFRIQVGNEGRGSARNVEVVASKLERLTSDGSRRIVAASMPMNLQWSNTNGTIHWPLLPKNIYRHCDLFHVMRPSDRWRHRIESRKEDSEKTSSGLMSFDLMVKSNTFDYLVDPGEYVLTLQMAAENTTTKRVELAIEYDGSWHDEQISMMKRIKITTAD